MLARAAANDLEVMAFAEHRDTPLNFSRRPGQMGKLGWRVIAHSAVDGPLGGRSAGVGFCVRFHLDAEPIVTSVLPVFADPAVSSRICGCRLRLHST